MVMINNKASSLAEEPKVRIHTTADDDGRPACSCRRGLTTCCVTDGCRDPAGAAVVARRSADRVVAWGTDELSVDPWRNNKRETSKAVVLAKKFAGRLLN